MKDPMSPATTRLYTSGESDIESLLQKSESEKSRVNAEFLRTNARLLEEVPKLQRLALKKVKGLPTEEFANDMVLALSDRIQAIPKSSRDWGTSFPQTKIKFDSAIRGTNMEDRRRQTHEALNRRFSQAKIDAETRQPNKSKKRPIEENKEKIVSNIKFQSADKTPKKQLLDVSHKKDVQVNEPAYLKLSHSVHEKLHPNGVELSSDGKVTVNRVLHELLQHGDAAQKYIHGSKKLKIENTILLDNYVSKCSMSSGRALQSCSKRSKKRMSRKQHKRIGSFDLPKEFHSFETFKPMHDKWKDYVVQVLKIVGKDQLAQCFLNADLHGAIMLVVQCKIVGHVGIHGIMVRETRETVGIITRDNKFRVVSKKGSVFVLQADCWKITLIGDKLSSRSLTP